MVTVDKFTKNGHKVSVNVWKDDRLNFEIFIDGESYDCGSTYIDLDTEDEHEEASSWATAMCADIENGRFVNVNGFWVLATESF